MFTYLKVSLLCCLLVLEGCAATPPSIIYKNILIAPPENLLINCLVVAPPDAADYTAASLQERERLLYTLSINQFKNIYLCNTQLSALRNWKQEQTTLYTTVAPKELSK